MRKQIYAIDESKAKRTVDSVVCSLEHEGYVRRYILDDLGVGDFEVRDSKIEGNLVVSLFPSEAKNEMILINTLERLFGKDYMCVNGQHIIGRG